MRSEMAKLVPWSALAPPWRHRMLATIMLSSALVAATIAFGPSDVSGVYPAKFWLDKAHWRAMADVVLAGDSRTYRALSPAHMSHILGNIRILNFGFASVGYSPQYLAAIQEVLDPVSPRKVVVLGVTPYSLTPKASRRNDFTENRLRPPRSTLDDILIPVVFRLEPMSLRKIPLPFVGASHYYEEFHPDGWVASRRVPERPGEAVGIYNGIFKGNTVDPRIQEGLVDQVGRWSRSGIRVYAFRPPTCQEMIDVENKRSGFDERALAAQFEAAGGTWLNADQTAYHTYDGSHLRRDAALTLSEDVARLIRRSEVISGQIQTQ